VVHTGKLITRLGRPRRKWKIILNCIFKEWDGDFDCIYLPEDRDRWRILANALTKSGAS
jgi:hypothetical protein